VPAAFPRPSLLVDTVLSATVGVSLRRIGDFVALLICLNTTPDIATNVAVVP